LEGLETVEVYFSAINKELRIDAQYFSKRFLTEDVKRYNHTNVMLGDIAFITDGPHGYHVVDKISPIAMLTAKCAKDFFASREEAETIALETHNANLRSSLQENDLILSTRGTVGLCAIVEQCTLPCNIDQDVARLAVQKETDIHPKFLLAYLNSSFGQDWILRNSTGMVQQGLSLSKIRTLPVPVLSSAFQKRIADVIDSASACRNIVKLQMQEAETTLLRALHLENWQAPEPLSYVRNSREAFAAGRLDAEHFQPKYDEIFEMMQNSGMSLVPLGKIIEPVKNGFDAREYVDVGTPYIRVGDIKNCHIDMDSAAKVLLSPGEINKDITLAAGDVLFTRKGSFGNAAPVFEEHEGAIISSEVMLLRIDDNWKNKILAEYLALFFDSLPGKFQAEKWAHGVAFYSISQGDLGRFRVPIIRQEKQEEIRRLFVESEQKRKEAIHFLESAKRAVEIAIEQDEAAALDFLRDASR
jgi:type I restriction enzyme M protein